MDNSKIDKNEQKRLKIAKIANIVAKLLVSLYFGYENRQIFADLLGPKKEFVNPVHLSKFAGVVGDIFTKSGKSGKSGKGDINIQDKITEISKKFKVGIDVAADILYILSILGFMPRGIFPAKLRAYKLFMSLLPEEVTKFITGRGKLTKKRLHSTVNDVKPEVINEGEEIKFLHPPILGEILPEIAKMNVDDVINKPNKVEKFLKIAGMTIETLVNLIILYHTGKYLATNVYSSYKDRNLKEKIRHSTVTACGNPKGAGFKPLIGSDMSKHIHLAKINPLLNKISTKMGYEGYNGLINKPQTRADYFNEIAKHYAYICDYNPKLIKAGAGYVSKKIIDIIGLQTDSDDDVLKNRVKRNLKFLKAGSLSQRESSCPSGGRRNFKSEKKTTLGSTNNKPLTKEEEHKLAKIFKQIHGEEKPKTDFDKIMKKLKPIINEKLDKNKSFKENMKEKFGKINQFLYDYSPAISSAMLMLLYGIISSELKKKLPKVASKALIIAANAALTTANTALSGISYMGAPSVTNAIRSISKSIGDLFSENNPETVRQLLRETAASSQTNAPPMTGSVELIGTNMVYHPATQAKILNEPVDVSAINAVAFAPKMSEQSKTGMELARAAGKEYFAAVNADTNKEEILDTLTTTTQTQPSEIPKPRPEGPWLNLEGVKPPTPPITITTIPPPPGTPAAKIDTQIAIPNTPNASDIVEEIAKDVRSRLAQPEVSLTGVAPAPSSAINELYPAVATELPTVVATKKQYKSKKAVIKELDKSIRTTKEQKQELYEIAKINPRQATFDYLDSIKQNLLKGNIAETLNSIIKEEKAKGDTTKAQKKELDENIDDLLYEPNKEDFLIPTVGIIIKVIETLEGVMKEWTKRTVPIVSTKTYPLFMAALQHIICGIINDYAYIGKYLSRHKTLDHSRYLKDYELWTSDPGRSSKKVAKGRGMFKNYPEHLINSKQLDKLHLQWFMIDNIPQSLPRGVYIINHDVSTGDGTHWCLLVIEKNVIYYVDSFGRAPPNEIVNFAKFNKKKLFANKYDIQPYDSNFCGYIAIYLARKFKRLMKTRQLNNKVVDSTISNSFDKKPSVEKMKKLTVWAQKNHLGAGR